MTRVQHWNDIRYTCVLEPKGLWGEFKLYQISLIHDDGVREYERADGTSSVDLTMDVAEAQVFASGSIKWDGCSNIKFDELESGVMIHGCDRDALLHIGEALARTYDVVASCLADWNPEMTDPKTVVGEEER